jgi:hypothetical protein
MKHFGDIAVFFNLSSRKKVEKAIRLAKRLGIRTGEALPLVDPHPHTTHAVEFILWIQQVTKLMDELRILEHNRLTHEEHTYVNPPILAYQSATKQRASLKQRRRRHRFFYEYLIEFGAAFMPIFSIIFVPSNKYSLSINSLINHGPEISNEALWAFTLATILWTTIRLYGRLSQQEFCWFLCDVCILLLIIIALASFILMLRFAMKGQTHLDPLIPLGIKTLLGAGIFVNILMICVYTYLGWHQSKSRRSSYVGG